MPRRSSPLGAANNGNIAYGDGTLGPGPHLPKAVDWGSFLKAARGFPRSIADVYTVMREDMMDFFIDAGVDGIIPDHLSGFLPIQNWATEYDQLRRYVKHFSSRQRTG